MSVHDPPGTSTCHFLVRTAPEIVVAGVAEKVTVAPIAPETGCGLEEIETTGTNFMYTTPSPPRPPAVR